MNSKRFLIASLIGALAGIFCAYGTKMSSDAGELGFVATNGIVASVFYNRLLIGMFIGMAGSWNLHPILRGALIGVFVSMAMGITPLLDNQPMGAVVIAGAGLVYGVIIDLLASWLSKNK